LGWVGFVEKIAFFRGKFNPSETLTRSMVMGVSIFEEVLNRAKKDENRVILSVNLGTTF